MNKAWCVGTILVVAAVVAGLAIGQGASAAVVWHVPGDFSTIQAALNAAADGDEIQVSPGTYRENLTITKDVLLRSTGGPGLTVVDGGGAGRVVTISEGVSASSATLEGFTIRGGAGAWEGGGVSLASASAVIRGNIIEDNRACDGAGIAMVGGAPRVEANIIRHNSRSGCSGGIGGGGILLRMAGSAVVVGNTIENNAIGSGPGGGLSLNAAGTPRIEGNIIRFNTASTGGGGVYVQNASDADLIQNLVYGNTAAYGGGIDWRVPSGQRGPWLLNNTIAENNAPTGSAVRADGYDGGVVLENNLLIGKAGQSAVYCTDTYGNVPPAFRYGNAFSAGAAAYAGSCGNPTGTNGNISADPQFVAAGGQDFHLFYGSPSIDMANSGAAGLPAMDLDGRGRILDGDRNGSAVVDMGAYEAATPALGEIVIGEVGQITDTLTHVPQTIVLTRSYAEPVVFAQPLSSDELDQALVRITDVQSDRFTLYVDEAPNKNGTHTTETVSYAVFEAGAWQLADGRLLEVDSMTTSAVVGRRISRVWATVTFASDFPVTPAVISQVQSNNDPGWVGTRQRNASANSVQLAMEAEEAATVRHGAEVVGWMAIEPGAGTWSGLQYVAGRTLDKVTHNWYTVNFGQGYSVAPRFLAAISRYDEVDSARLRYRKLTATSVQVRVEEDTTYDSEQIHTTEMVDYLALAASGQLTVPGGVVQPTPVPSSTPRTPVPTATPEATATWTPTVELTVPPTIVIPTMTQTAPPTIVMPTLTQTVPPTIVIPTLTQTVPPTIVIPTLTQMVPPTIAIPTFTPTITRTPFVTATRTATPFVVPSPTITPYGPDG
jgi:nitrous oxidase accessory protein NosD